MLQKTVKPWGYELLFALTDKYAGKLLHIEEGKRTSLQYHKVKDETMYFQRGLAEVTKGNNIFMVGGGAQEMHFEPGERHRVKALTECDIIEVSTPQLDDVVRLEDDYGRV